MVGHADSFFQKMVIGMQQQNRGSNMNNSNNGGDVPVDRRLWPIVNDLLIILGNDKECTGSVSQTVVEDLTFVVRSLCRRVANQQLKEKCISMIGGTNEPHSAPIMVNCGPENFNKPGDTWKSATLTLQDFNWTFLIEAKTAGECTSYIQCEPAHPNTVWSCTARFFITINNINFESPDMEFSFDTPRMPIAWRNSPTAGLIPRAQIRNPLKVQMGKVGVRVLPIPDFVSVSPDDANTSVYVEGKPVPVNFQLLSYHCPALRGQSVVDGKFNLPGVALTPFRSFLDNLINNAPVNATNVGGLLDVSSHLQCVMVRERCEQFLVQTTELPYPVKLDLATRYKLAVAQAYCLAVIRNHKEVDEARNDPEFTKMSELAKMAFTMKEKSLGTAAPSPPTQQGSASAPSAAPMNKAPAAAPVNNTPKPLNNGGGGASPTKIPSLMSMASAPGPMGPGGPMGMGMGPGAGPMGMGGGPMRGGMMGLGLGGPMRGGMGGLGGPGMMRGGMMGGGMGPMRGGMMGGPGPMGPMGMMRGGMMMRGGGPGAMGRGGRGGMVPMVPQGKVQKQMKRGSSGKAVKL